MTRQPMTSLPTSILCAERPAQAPCCYYYGDEIRAPSTVKNYREEIPMSYVAHDESAFAPPAEVEEVELYHPKTWVGKYVWSQDAKVIAVQYATTAIGIGLV